MLFWIGLEFYCASSIQRNIFYYPPRLLSKLAMSSLLSFFMAGCKNLFNNDNGGDHACEGGYDLNYDDDFDDDDFDDDDDDGKKYDDDGDDANLHGLHL